MFNWCFTTSPGWSHLLCSSGWSQTCNLSTLVSRVIGCMHVPLYLVPPYSLCVYLCGRYIHVCAFMCICVCGGYVECFSFFLSTLFLQDRVCHWTRSSLFRLDCLVPLISVSTVLGDVMCTAMPGFYAGALDPNSSCFHSDTVPTKPSPQPFQLILSRFSCHFHLCPTLPCLELSYWQLYETLLTLSRSLWVHPAALPHLYSLTLYFLFGCFLPPHPHHDKHG